MTHIRVCKGSNSGEKFSLGKSGSIFWLSVLNMCSSYKPRDKKITFLAGGSYGAVFDVYVTNRKRHTRHNVALKVITIGKIKNAKARKLKEETLSEMHFGQMMSDANIGPKIYDQFIFQKKIKGDVNEWGLILMEKFQGSCGDFLWKNGSGRKWGAPPTVKNRAIVIRKMMELAKQMVSKGLYCWDIKPGNYVVNVNGGGKIKVRMIDFGGQFCVFGEEERNHMISAIRSSAHNYSLVPGLFPKELKGARILAKLTVKQFNKVFYHLIMMPFLVLLNDRFTGFDFQMVARPILHKICKDDILRLGMMLLLENNPVIFKTFHHYTKRLGGSLKGPEQMVSYFTSVLHDLCFQNTPSKSSRRKKTRKSKTHNRLKAARRTRRKAATHGGKSFNPHTLIPPGLIRSGQMSLLARGLHKPNRIAKRLSELYDVLT